MCQAAKLPRSRALSPTFSCVLACPGMERPLLWSHPGNINPQRSRTVTSRALHCSSRERLSARMSCVLAWLIGRQPSLAGTHQVQRSGDRRRYGAYWQV